MMNFGKSRAKMQDPESQNIRFDQVAGLQEEKEELKEISDVCHAYNLPLFLDGARLGYGLMSYDTDVTLEDIAEITETPSVTDTPEPTVTPEADKDNIFDGTEKDITRSHFQTSEVLQISGRSAGGWRRENFIQ